MTRSHLKSLLLVATLATTLATLPIGCGPKAELFPVRGIVVLSDGQPLAQASISLESVDLRHVGRATTDEQGRFSMQFRGQEDGLPEATYRGLILPSPGQDLDQATPLPFPIRYTRYTTSGLEFTIDGPVEDLRIALE